MRCPPRRFSPDRHPEPPCRRAKPSPRITGSFTLVLSGGSLPNTLSGLLTSKQPVQWDKFHVFFVSRHLPMDPRRLRDGTMSSNSHTFTLPSGRRAECAPLQPGQQPQGSERGSAGQGAYPGCAGESGPRFWLELHQGSSEIEFS